MKWMSVWLILFLVLVAGCQNSSLDVVLNADDSRGFAYGQDGSYGVGVTTRTFRVRVDEHNDVRLMVPTTRTGALASGQFPLVIFVAGGLVPSSRYDWLMAHVASRGFIVAAPEYPLDLALFAINNTVSVTNAIRHAASTEGDWLHGRVHPMPGVVMGHSLGGVVAASSWLDSPKNYEALVLLASEPNSADDFSGRATPSTRVLSLAGSIDGSIDVPRTYEGAQAMETSGATVTFGVIEQMNHYQWTTEYTVDEIEKDTPPVISDETAQYRGVYLLDVLLEEIKTGARLDILDRPELWPTGVQTYSQYCEEGTC